MPRCFAGFIDDVSPLIITLISSARAYYAGGYAYAADLHAMLFMRSARASRVQRMSGVREACAFNSLIFRLPRLFFIFDADAAYYITPCHAMP